MKVSAILSPVGRHTPVILLVLTWSGQVVGGSRGVDFMQWITTGSVVVLGTFALGWLRPSRVGLTAPRAMLLLGAIGMLLGLVFDSRSTDLALLESLCVRANIGLWPMMQLHLDLMPWMHVGMWVGGLAAIPLLRAMRITCRRQYCARLVQNVACSAWMTVGMSVGAILFEHVAWQSSARGASLMLGAMFSGMVWGMVASVALYRLYFRVTSYVGPLAPVAANLFSRAGDARST